jgi:hypothetical protein
MLGMDQVYVVRPKVLVEGLSATPDTQSARAGPARVVVADRQK